jgi:hypothetical protein
MAQRRLYFGIENLALTNAQRNTLVAGLQQLGANGDSQPCNRNHWRIRLDNQAAIFEALFDDSQLTIAALKSRLATIFGIAANDISHATSTTGIGFLVTLSYQSVARLRVLLFGGASATHAESHAAVLNYLATNAAAWNTED